MRFALAISVVVGLLFMAGCGGGEGNPVSGTVKLKNGTPLATGRIIFEAKKGPSGFTADIGPDGTFTVPQINQPAAGDYIGYLSGVQGQPQYQVDPATMQHSVIPAGKKLVADKYLDAKLSDIAVSVKPGQNKFDIVVDGVE
jgi:hypothetical protein